jgi:uncharacterized protein (DUF433 family)
MPPLSDIIVRDPEILGGTPVFRGTRVPLQALFDYLGGETRWKNFSKDTRLSRARWPSARWKKLESFYRHAPKCAF